MKKIYAFTISKKSLPLMVMALLLMTTTFNQKASAQNGTAINTTGALPNPAAILDLSSTSQGFLMPRLTTEQIGAMTLNSSANGLMVLNTTTNCVQIYLSTLWQNMYCGCTPPTAPVPAGNTSTGSQIVWNWLPVTGASGYKWNTIDSYNTAVENGTSTSLTQNGQTCASQHTIYVWAYSSGCGNSPSRQLTQTTGACDVWTPITSFGGVARNAAVAFSIGTKGYVGTGQDQSNTYRSDFWSWNQTTNSWTQIADFAGGPRYQAVAFTIADTGYVGTGFYYSGNPPQYKYNDFYKYDVAGNQWIQKASMPSGGRYGGVGIAIGNKGYVGFGRMQGVDYTSDFYEFDPTTSSQGSWTQKADYAGGTRQNPIGFSIGSMGYVGMGGASTGDPVDFYEYNPSLDQWTRKADFIDSHGLVASVGFSLGSKGYVGTGLTNALTNSFWEYDPSGNSWSQKTSFSGAARWFSVAFAIGSKGYIGLGSDWPGNWYTDFYEYK